MDLVRLGSKINGILSDSERTSTAYRKALDAASDYPGLEKIMDALGQGFEDKVLARDTLDKALATATETTRLLDTARRADNLLADRAFTRQILDAAESAVNSLDEMKALAKGVDELAADDAERVARVKDKLEKREASQARYVEFQKKEATLQSATAFIELAEDVYNELEDSFYASKLLGRAEELQQEKGFDLDATIDLALAVDRFTDDADWLKRLLELCAQKAYAFPQIRRLGEAAARLGDREFGKTWARELYSGWTDRIADTLDNSAFEFGKLANAVRQDIGDPDWAKQLLNTARDNAKDHYALLHLRLLASQWNETELADELQIEAAKRCTRPEDFTSLVQWLRKNQTPAEQQRKLYAMGETQLSDAIMRLRWVEGIADLFGDKDWAGEAYAKLAEHFTDGVGKQAYENSRNRRLGHGKYY